MSRNSFGCGTHVTPQCAGGLALELMLGTVGTGANAWDRCVGVGTAGVGVGAASGAVSAPASGTNGPPKPLPNGGASGF